ncbi:MAG: hypothetical protein QGI83_19010 [Candidatus Latescibacteria bacterium]|jgi:hypothetical protein|nr:hypothetical protein [Candidatus Latescibacterota bacterium]
MRSTLSGRTSFGREHGGAGSTPAGRQRAVAILLLLASVLWSGFASGQRHLPNLQVFRSAMPLLLDTQVEDPAVNNGQSGAPLPRVGQILELQCFVPRAAGLAAFECSVEFGDSVDAFTSNFRITSAKDCFGNDMKPVKGSKGAVHSQLRVGLGTVPTSGHILTVSLSPTRQLSGIPSLDVRVTVTIASVPERRVWQMEGRSRLNWR